MKPRVLQPHKILAAVLTVTCAPAAAGAATAFAAPARVSPPTDDSGYPLVGNLVRKGDPPKPAPPPPPKPKPNPTPSPTPKPALR